METPYRGRNTVVDPQGGPWALTYHWAEVNGRVECVGLDIRSFFMEGDDATTYRPVWADTAAVPISASFLRSLPVASLVRRARLLLGASAGWKASKTGDKATRAVLRSVTAELAESPRRLHGIEHFQRVAEVYSAAWQRGDHPTKAVAEEMKATRSAAAKWVARARELGLLGPTDQRRAGGAAVSDINDEEH